VSGGLQFQSISAGETFTCGVTTTGVAYCWGDNVYGQLGRLGPTSLVPSKLPFQP
jgi:alpha-tubulin suppressor-like RCC1 family protein